MNASRQGPPPSDKNRIWTVLVTAGIADDASEEHAESVRILNMACLLASGITFSFLLVFPLVGQWFLAVMSAVVSGGFFLAYLLSGRGHQRLGASFAFTVLTLVMMTLISVLGTGVFESIFVAMIAIAFLFFGYWGGNSLLFAVAAVVVVGGLSQVVRLPVPTQELTQGTADALRVMYLGGALGFTALVQWYFFRARRHSLDALERALVAARAANVAKSEFLANMSHEIRTPMNGVLGMLDILRDEPLSDRHRDYIETAHSSGRALLELLGDILDLSKIESGHLRFEPAAFDLLSTLEDILEQFAPAAQNEDPRLLMRYPDEVPRHLIADVGRLRQVLINLIGNAVKFTERGHVLTTVSSESLGPGRVQIRVEIEDTGIGMAPGVQERIFEKFEQADGSSSRQYMGTGLGLAICRQLIERMGGEIGVRSQEGHGTTFFFTLPMDRAPDPAPSPAPPLEPTLTGIRVLVADPHASGREHLCEQLRDWQIECDACANGQTLVRRLRTAHERGQPYDIAVIDHRLGDMDALAAARAIRQLPDREHLVLIAAGSLADQLEPGDLQRAGYSGRLLRPARRAELWRILAHAWSERQEKKSRRWLERRSLVERARIDTGKRRSASLRVLLVEDNAINQKVATRMLAGFGCQVEVAGNGREAVEMAARGVYDLLFMDIQMPEMDGLEATRRIRRERAADAPPLPIVAMTAHAMSGDRERFLATGMDDYVAKPIDRAALARVLARFSEPAEAEADDQADDA